MANKVGLVARMGTASALDKSKWKDLLINGGIFMLSALLTFLANNLTNMDFGQYTGVITAALAIALKYAQSWLQAFINPVPAPVVPVNPPKPNDGNFDVH